MQNFGDAPEFQGSSRSMASLPFEFVALVLPGVSVRFLIF